MSGRSFRTSSSKRLTCQRRTQAVIVRSHTVGDESRVIRDSRSHISTGKQRSTKSPLFEKVPRHLLAVELVPVGLQPRSRVRRFEPKQDILLRRTPC